MITAPRAGCAYTPTELKFMERLSDGMAHKVTELMTLLPDAEGADYGTVAVVICGLRKKLPQGHLIIAETRGFKVASCYRHVLMLAGAEE